LPLPEQIHPSDVLPARGEWAEGQWQIGSKSLIGKGPVSFSDRTDRGAPGARSLANLFAGFLASEYSRAAVRGGAALRWWCRLQDCNFFGRRHPPNELFSSALTRSGAGATGAADSFGRKTPFRTEVTTRRCNAPKMPSHGAAARVQRNFAAEAAPGRRRKFVAGRTWGGFASCSSDGYSTAGWASTKFTSGSCEIRGGAEKNPRARGGT